MTSYIANNYKPFRYIYSNIQDLVILLMLIWLFRFLFSNNNLFIVTVVIYTLVFVIRIAWADRIKQVIFDQDKKEVLVLYTHFWERKVERFYFDEIKTKVYRKRAKSFRFLAEPISISIHQGVRKYAHFELNKSKDGFSNERLEEIVVHFKSLSIQVTEKFI